ncbi:MAG: low affinity iron permease family protein [Candidatus Pacebacteria bacterium]|nr:low affinity iron permease family protein [Candidatus Paceibacterota bacterium]
MLNNHFRRLANKIARLAGTFWVFFAAVLLILTWLTTGPVFGFSDTWQLVINTTTTIVTFLMVFLIQNTQNRDSRAVHLKLDELIKAAKGARNKMLNVEDLTDDELEALHQEFLKLAEKYAQQLTERRKKRRRKKK